MAASFHCPRRHLPHHNAGGVPRSRGQPHCPAPPLPTLGAPNTLIASSASRTPRQHQPHANPNSIKPRQREHSVPRQPDRTEPRPHANPDPERSPAQAQPSPAQPKSFRSRYLGTDGAAAQGAAGAAHGAPAGPAQPRGAGRGIARQAAPVRDGTGRDGISRPSWQAEKNN